MPDGLIEPNWYFETNGEYSATRKGNKIYVNVFNSSKTALLLPAIEGVKIGCRTWKNEKAADWKEADRQYKIIIQSNLPDKNSNVLVRQNW